MTRGRHMAMVPTAALAAMLATLIVSAPQAVAQRAEKQPSRSQSSAKVRATALAAVKSWGIHLRKFHRDDIATSPFDLMVVDYAPYRHLTFEFPFNAGDVAAMKTKPDGSRRLVLAYLSIGEAEDYRYYWRREWSEQAPAWMAPENTAWPGNFPVEFWRPEWQRILFQAPDSYLARILAAGFDGIYLDRADVFQEWLPKHPRAEAQMISLIRDLAGTARRAKPDFLVVLQNAEELMRHAEVRHAIDAIAKEDLFYEAETKGVANSMAMVEASLAHLRRARRDGLKVFVLEYVETAAAAADIRTRAVKEGFLPHFAERSLGTLTLKAPDEIAPTPPR